MSAGDVRRHPGLEECRVEFLLLGPVAITIDGQQVDIGPPRRRAVLAALLIDVGLPVPADILIDRVWGADPPSEVRNNLHSHIARLRRALAEVDSGAGAGMVERRSGGYMLRVEPNSVDLNRFRDLVERARARQLPPRERATLLRQALALWRGDPLDGVPGQWAAQVRTTLAQQRSSALAQWGAAEIDIGGYDAVVDLMAPAVSADPLNEPLAAVLIRALLAAGRKDQARAWYMRTAEALADALGTEPGAELRELNEMVTPSVAPMPKPAQLPADLVGFVGRSIDLRRLDELVPGVGNRHGGAVTVCAIGGTAGVGKTTLAVHWAHRIADRFPDGQLYVNLRGFDPSGAVLDPAEAVRGFIDAFEVPPDGIPFGSQAQITLYRSLLTDRRILILLDNARDADQVRPLLPDAPGCMVVVTSRSQLPGLVAEDGTHAFPLDLPTHDEARRVLRGRLGDARVDAEPDAARARPGRRAGRHRAGPDATGPGRRDPRRAGRFGRL
jgi:DNA-binding SARP family transcriptional activator